MRFGPLLAAGALAVGGSCTGNGGETSSSAPASMPATSGTVTMELIRHGFEDLIAEVARG